MIDVRISARLLRTHVRGSAERNAEVRDLGAIGAARGGERFRHAKISADRRSSGEEHIIGLDVAMNHAVLVGVGERARHFAQDADRVGDGQLAAALALERVCRAEGSLELFAEV
jgi:hypothetical protein